MIYQSCAPLFSSFSHVLCKKYLSALCSIFALSIIPHVARAQDFTRELDAPEKPSITIRNANGRISVIAANKQDKKISLMAKSSSASVTEQDVLVASSKDSIDVEARARSSSAHERDRIDLTLRVPPRARVKVETDAGAVDIVGNLAFAEVKTNTGTIHADVPLDSVRFNFVWEASRPRFLSDAELPNVKEHAAGMYTINGKLGDKKAPRDERVELDFKTARGVILFNVDPDSVPADLRERPLTKAAQAMIKSGDTDLSDAIRKISPKLFAEYTEGLPPLRGEEPRLGVARAPGEITLSVAPQTLRLNARVTDRNGRAISNLVAKDFVVYENGEERAVRDVEPVNAPFNLVLLLDVSGSVEERIDFIRKAARNFLNTTSAQDRIAIISFRDDVQVLSNFTTDRKLLSARLNDIEAGGATALYDALAYALVDTLKPLRGERTGVVILSDGDDNRSFVPFSTVLETVIESGALIYPLYIPSGLIPEASAPASETTLDPLRTRYLTLTTRAEEEGKELARASGGVYYPIQRFEDLQRAYNDVVAQLRTAYTITYVSNASDSKAERRIRISVRNRDGAAVQISPVVNVATTKE